MARVRIDVECGRCHQILGTWYDRIEEKYPFWCDSCEDAPRGSYPWVLTTTVEADDAARI